jgi:hypothetical protein
MTWTERRRFGKWEPRQATLLANAARTSEIFFPFFLGEKNYLNNSPTINSPKKYLNSLEDKCRVLVHVDGITKRSVEFSLFQMKRTVVLIMAIEMQTCISLGTMSGILAAEAGGD